jgi:hypothetical protein
MQIRVFIYIEAETLRQSAPMLSFFCQIHSEIFNVLQYSVSVLVASRGIIIRQKQNGLGLRTHLLGTSIFQSVFKNMVAKNY